MRNTQYVKLNVGVRADLVEEIKHLIPDQADKVKIVEELLKLYIYYGPELFRYVHIGSDLSKVVKEAMK